jgi:biopolymer transport protein TolR
VPVYVKADQTLEYGEVVRVMTVLQQAGAQSVGLITDPPDLSASAG